MVKVITYGTFDVLHKGHIRLLQRAKVLGDYLIVGVTSDDYDRTRGKINNKQTLLERIEAVKALNIADEVIIEEYDGQKIDDIRKYGVDIFTVGSDWEGTFDYLNDFCRVVYLPRTVGVSSTEIRSETRKLKFGVVGDVLMVKKFISESKFVNGCEIVGLCSENKSFLEDFSFLNVKTSDYDELLTHVDALYINSDPSLHYVQTKKALKSGKHVICESPIAMSEAESSELFALADEKGLILMDGIKTAYSTAFTRMLLLIKSGVIGDVVSVDATCTSLKNEERDDEFFRKNRNSMSEWAPTVLLPVFQIFGTDYRQMRIIAAFSDQEKRHDAFSKFELLFEHGVASAKVGNGVKSEGELVVSGTKGYVYVPAPWWKTDYFEIRYENPENNKRYFYQLSGEGIRYEIVAFVKAIESGKLTDAVSRDVSRGICKAFEKRDVIEI